MWDEMRDEAPNFVILKQVTHQTREARMCDCGRVIPAGARYERCVGTEDGTFFTSVRCVKFSPDYDCPYPHAPDPFEQL